MDLEEYHRTRETKPGEAHEWWLDVLALAIPTAVVVATVVVNLLA